MLEYKIVTDSSANLLSNKEGTLVSVPLTIRIGDRDYVDDETLNTEVLRDALASTKEKTSTSCPSFSKFYEACHNAKRVYVLLISSAVSGSYNAAVLAAKEFQANHPDVEIHVFDTLSTGPKNALLVEKIHQLESQGLSFKEVVDEMNLYLQNTHLLYALCTIENLAKNGRVNPAIAKIAGILGIHFLGEGSKEGKVKILGQCRGCKKAFSKLFEEMKKNGYNGKAVVIHHVNNLDAANQLKDLILKEYPFAQITVGECRGLCTYYAEEHGLMIGYEGIA